MISRFARPAYVCGLPSASRCVGSLSAVSRRPPHRLIHGISSAPGHQPPLAVRASLVGASTALATPLFPVIGLNQLLFRYASPELRVALTGGASLLQFSLMTLVPNAFYYAPLLLPFALGNGLTAAAAYLVVEAGAGGPAALSRWAAGPIPVAGPLLGIIVALAAPLTYPSAFSVVWPGGGGGGIGLSDELFGPGSLSYLDLIYNRVTLPCLATTGAISGALLHVGLQPVILGRPGVPWPYLAGAVLGAVGACPSSARRVNDRLFTLGGGIGAGLSVVYSTGVRVDVPHAREVRLDELPPSGFWSSWSAPGVTCYVEGWDSLCWLAALDEDGSVVSELRPTATSSAGARVRDGGARAAEAESLLAVAADPRLRCHSSERSAYFDGLGGAPLDRKAVLRLAQSRPAAELLLTDATVLLVAGRVPPAVVQAGLEACCTTIAASPFVARRREAFHLASSWVDSMSPSSPRWDSAEAVASLMADLALRRAQLGELWRLRRGDAAGPASAEGLEGQLSGAGIDVSRALAALDELMPRAAAPGAREADWRVLAAHARAEQAASRRMGGAAAFAAALALGGMAAYASQ